MIVSSHWKGYGRTTQVLEYPNSTGHSVGLRFITYRGFADLESVREALRDRKTYLWFVMFFCVACPSGGIGTFGGLITKGFGFNSFDAILMQIPTGVIGIIFILGNIYLQDKIKIRSAFIA